MILLVVDGKVYEELPDETVCRGTLSWRKKEPVQFESVFHAQRKANELFRNNPKYQHAEVLETVTHTHNVSRQTTVEWDMS